jgi:hypothetical protein
MQVGPEFRREFTCGVNDVTTDDGGSDEFVVTVYR